MSLEVVKPITITDAMLIATDVTEADYPTWSGATTYALGDRVIDTTLHKVYESLQAGNLNHTPASSPTWWIEVGPTNRWKVFDTSNSTATEGDDNSSVESISYTLRPGQTITGIGVLNIVNGMSVTIVMDDPTYGVVYNETFDLGALPESPEWWPWFFGERSTYVPQVVVTGLPIYPNADITITVLGSAAQQLSVGAIVLGQVRTFSLGIRYGARVGIQDYSRRETNDWGDVVLVQRAFAKRASFDMLVEADEVDELNNFLTSVRSTPCLWIGSTDYDALIIFGFYKTYDILISYPTYSDASLEIEGMT